MTHAPEMQAPTRRRRKRVAPWIAWSVLLHLLLIAILGFTPLGEAVFERLRRDEDDLPVVEAAEIEELVETVRQIEAERLTFRLEELYAVADRMQIIGDRQETQYRTLAEHLAADAPRRAAATLEDITAAQDAAIRSQEAAQKAMAGDLNRARRAIDKTWADPEADRKQISAATDAANAARKRVAEKQEAATASQVKAGDLQKKAARALEFAGAPFRDTRKALAGATDAQKAADAAQDRASSLRQEAGETMKWAQNKARYSERSARRAAERAEQQVAGETGRLEKAAAGLAQAEKRRAEARRKSAAEPDNTGAARAAKRAAQQVQRAAQQVADRKKRLEKARRLAAERAEKLAAAEKEAAEHAARVADLRKRADAAQQNALAAQRAARDAQREATKTIRKVAAAAAAQADAQQIAVPEPPPARRRPAADITELYEAAVEAETRIAETHQHIRAAQSAVRRRIPLSETLANTRVAQTDRPALDRALLTETVRTAARAAAHKEEVARAEREVDNMVTAAYQRLAEAQATGMDGGQGTAVGIEQIRAAGARAAAMAAKAEKDAGRYQDLTALMKDAGATASAGSVPTGGGGPGLPGPRQTPGGMVATSATRLAGRRAGAEPDRWCYVDTWYLLGPYDNPRRRNIETRYPPESTIDLDAVYPGAGKGGRDLRWRFAKAPWVKIKPSQYTGITEVESEYTIWYAYTELRFAEARDAWIAVGSDDFSRISVNGEVVWTSSKNLKGWTWDEGFRRVHFRKGVNRVLYRLENGWREAAFSFMICLAK